MKFERVPPNKNYYKGQDGCGQSRGVGAARVVQRLRESLWLCLLTSHCVGPAIGPVKMRRNLPVFRDKSIFHPLPKEDLGICGRCDWETRRIFGKRTLSRTTEAPRRKFLFHLFSLDRRGVRGIYIRA